MSDKITEFSKKYDIKTPIRHAHPQRRPFLQGKAVRNVLLAAALTGGAITGANLLKNNPQPGNNEISSPAPTTQVIEKPNPTINPETSQDKITVGELNPNKPPTEKLNGIVMIKINNDKDVPAVRTSPDNLDDSNLYGAGWSSLSELNGVSIDKAVNSNGQIELVLTDPLITRSVNPDDGSKDSGIWITAVSEGKPVYFFAGQATAGLVMIEPTGGSKKLFESVSASDNALDFGKVNFQNTP